MDHQAYKEVYFDKYCKTCEYKGNEETEEPCDECLAESINLNSHKPVKYKEKKMTHEKTRTQ